MRCLTLTWEGNRCWVLVLELLTLVRCSGTVPEESPLQGLTALELVFEAEGVVLVGELEEICQVGLEYS